MSEGRYQIQISDNDRSRFREMSRSLSAYDILNTTDYLQIAYPHFVDFVFRLKITRYLGKDEVLGMINQCLLALLKDKENTRWLNTSIEKLQRYLMVAVKNNFTTQLKKENNRKALLYNHYISNGLVEGRDYIEQRIEKKIDGDLIKAIDTMIKKDSKFLTKQLLKFWNFYKQDLEVSEICSFLKITPNNYYQLHDRFLKRIVSKIFNGNT